MKKRYLVSGLLIVVLASLAISLYLTSTIEKSPEKIKVEATIDFGELKKNEIVTVDKGTTVFEVLDSIANVEYKEYAGMGKLVTSIDDVSINDTHSWMFFVDDELAPVAADKYILTEESTFTFEYMSNEEAFQYVS